MLTQGILAHLALPNAFAVVLFGQLPGRFSELRAFLLQVRGLPVVLVYLASLLLCFLFEFVAGLLLGGFLFGCGRLLFLFLGFWLPGLFGEERSLLRIGAAGSGSR